MNRTGRWLTVGLLAAALAAAGARKSDDSSLWDTETGVTKLFDTPGGAVYEFPLSPYFRGWEGANYERRNVIGGVQQYLSQYWIKPSAQYLSVSFSSIQYNFLASSGREDDRLKRFVVLDFGMRCFPALSKEADPTLRFILFRSQNGLAQRGEDLDGTLHFNSEVPFYEYFFNDLRDFSWQYRFRFRGAPYRPNYEWMTLRVVFDTAAGGTNRTLVNGESVEFSNLDGPDRDEAFARTLGIAIPQWTSYKSWRSASNRKDLYYVLSEKGAEQRRIFEFSQPVVRMFDTAAEVNRLPPVVFTPYDYERYFDRMAADSAGKDADRLERTVRSSRNPDMHYAYALRKLYGEDCDPEGALAYLERAADKEHVPAFYQLALCHYRGFGVRPDPAKALKYLEKARKFRHPDVNALYLDILWAQQHRSPLLSPQLRRELATGVAALPELDGNAVSNFARLLWTGRFDARTTGVKLAALAAALNVRPEPMTFYFSASNIFGNSILDDERRKELEKYEIPQNFVTVPPSPVPADVREAARRTALIKYPPLGCLVPAAIPEADRSAYLAAAAKGGSMRAQVEELYGRFRAGALTAADFSPERQFRLGDDPLYELIRFSAANPDYAGVAEFRDGDLAAAVNIWKKDRSPQGRFLYAGGVLHRVLALEVAALPRLALCGDTATLLDAYRALGEAAAAGLPSAMYLYALALRNQPPQALTPDTGRARTLLADAADKGHGKAALLLAEIDYRERRRVGRVIMPELAAGVMAGSPDALLLRGRVYAESTTTVKDAMVDFEAAARMGSSEACRELALLSKDPAQKRVWWKRFLAFDRLERFNDPLDVFDPDLQVNQAFISGIAPMIPQGETSSKRYTYEIINQNRSRR